MPMQPWKVTQDPLTLRRMGKLGEELGELQAVVSRIIIQGIDAIDPSTGKPNRQRLEEEMADVHAQLGCTTGDLHLDAERIRARAATKVQQMLEWEEVLQLQGA